MGKSYLLLKIFKACLRLGLLEVTTGELRSGVRECWEDWQKSKSM